LYKPKESTPEYNVALYNKPGGAVVAARPEAPSTNHDLASETQLHIKHAVHHYCLNSSNTKMLKHDILPKKTASKRKKYIMMFFEQDIMILEANKMIIHVIQRSTSHWNQDNVHPPFVNR
jgi:hypothetical protein